MQTLSYEMPGTIKKWAGDKHVSACIAAMATLTVLANAFVVYSAIADEGPGAFAVTFVWGPICNCVLIAIWLCLTPLVKRVAQGASVDPYVTAAVYLPIICAQIAFIVAYLMCPKAFC